MRKVHNLGVLVLSLCLLAWSSGCAACPLPLYYEYIPEFTLKSDDVNNTLNNQLSKVQIGSISVSNNLRLNDVRFSTIYDGSKHRVTSDGLKIKVEDDGFKIQATFSAVVSHTVGKSTYNVVLTADGGKISYQKEITAGNSRPKISNTKVTLAATALKYTATPSPSSADAKKLNEGIQGNQGTTFYTKLIEQLNQIQKYMNQNCKSEQISEQFPSGKYEYRNRDDVMIIDMGSLTFAYGNDKVLTNGINGSIIGLQEQKCFGNIPERVNNAHTFISKQFAYNLLLQAWGSYKQFKNVEISRSTIRTETFQFRLLDLQYVVPKVLENYPEYFTSEISFSCSALQIIQFQLGKGQNTSFTDIKWKCKGQFLDKAKKSVQIADFEPTIRHIFKISVGGSSFSVYSDRLIIQNIAFNPVGDLIVEDAEEAKIYMEEMFNDLRTYTVGTYFTVKSGTNTITYDDYGMWLSSGKANQQPQQVHLKNIREEVKAQITIQQ